MPRQQRRGIIIEKSEKYYPKAMLKIILPPLITNDILQLML